MWALRISFVEGYGDGTGGVGAAPRLSILTAPQASNPNLNAQSGLCISQAYGSIAGHLATFDQIIECIVDRLAKNLPQAADLPVLRRFTLPATEAPTLLRPVSYEEISAAFMFPGGEGAVQSLREQSLWDRPPAARETRATGF